MVRATKSARVCTRMVAAEVSTGKNERSDEYAAPLAMPKQPSSRAESKVRFSRKGRCLRTAVTVKGP